MGALTEIEIFDQLNTSFRIAIETCEDLARLPLKGAAYDKFRRQLRLIEGCAKQANTWREDTRWLFLIRIMGETHQRAGDWLRGIKQEDGTRVKIADGHLHPAFTMMADNLRALHKLAEQLRTKATGRVGMILPTPLPGPHRDTRPVGFTKSISGLLIPDSVSASATPVQ